MKIGIGQQEKISKKVLKLIDFIEIKELTSENIKYFSQFKKPFLFHCQNFRQKRLAWGSDSNFAKLMTQNEVKKIINSSDFDWFSFHLALAREKIKIKVEDEKYDLIGFGKKFSRKELLEKLHQNIQELKKAYPDFKLAFESCPFEPTDLSNGAFDYICEPEFINKVIKDNSCYFLLDIPHCFVSAKNLGYKNPKDYFSKLPLERTLEIHISRAKKYKGEDFWRDAHLPITEKEIDLLKWLLTKAKNVKAITLEAQGLHPEKTLIKELRLLRNLFN